MLLLAVFPLVVMFVVAAGITLHDYLGSFSAEFIDLDVAALSPPAVTNAKAMAKTTTI